MALGDHGSARDSAAPSRNLRRVGLICVMAAAAIAGFGIFQRRSQEAEVAGWTRERAVPSVAAVTPNSAPLANVWSCTAQSKPGTKRRSTRGSAAI